MGFFTDADPGFRTDTATLAPLPRFTDSDPAAAAFRQNNLVASTYNAIANSGAFEPDPTHNPLDVVKGTRYEQQHLAQFVGSRSEAETRNIMRRIDQEDADRRTLEAAGTGGVLLSMLAGVTDPTILMPASIAFKATRAGYEVSRAALAVGAAGALQSGVQEAGLQATQLTRPLSESAINVGSGTILAGLLGGAATRLLSPVERANLVRSLDTARADMDAHATPQPRAESVAPVSSAPPLIPEPGAAIRLDPGEKIEGPAIKVGDKIYTGISHTDALDRASKELKISEEEFLAQLEGMDNVGLDGFVTSDGRFLTRKEAYAIVEAKESTGTGVAQAAGAAGTDTRTLEMQSSIPGTSRLSTTRRTLEAESVVARRAMADTAETPYSYKESAKGVAATQGPPIDRIVKMEKDGLQYSVGQELDRLFIDYRFGADPPAMARMRAGIADLTGGSEGKMGYAEFKKAVSDAAMFGDAHEIPQVAAAAQFIRNKVIEPWAARAEGAIDGFERLTPAAGETYFPHAWNKEKIKAQRPQFTDRLTELYQADQATKSAAKERLTKLSADLEVAQGRLAKATSPEAAAAAKLEHDAVRAKIEAEVAAWEGKSVAEAKSAIKAREKYAAKTERDEDADPLKSADKTIDRAVKKIIESHRDLDAQELRSVAQQTVDRILGSPDGRLPYDVFKGGQGGFGGTQQRGSLAERQLNVTNAWARDWIETDIEHVVNSHLRTLVPDVVIAERHGDVEMTQVMRAVQEDYARLIDATKSEKQSTKLGNERDAVIRDLAAVRDRIRGVYGWDPTTSGNLGRIVAATKQVNNITSMGMSAIASLSDFAGAPFRHGFINTFADAWAPFLKSMITRNEGLEKQKAHLKSLGLGVDTALNLRQHAFDDIVDGYRPQSRVERALQWTSDKFFVANGLAPLTDLQKQLAASVEIPAIIRASKAIVEGKATKAQIRDMADAGIDANMASRIHRQMYELGHGTVVDGVHLPNTADWTDAGARQAFDGAVARAVDIMVVTPGQEKPLTMSKPIGSLVFQFKSFPMAATERILISNLQRRDAKALSGMVTSVALGMLSYKINSMLGGQPVSDDPRQWIKEGINRSGMTGILEEANGMAAKLSRGSLDIHRLYGADKPLSRFASRSVADSFLGPTAGKLAQIGQVGGAAFSGEWGESDTKAVRRLTFFQNLFWLRQAFNQVETSTNSYFNIPEKTKPN